MKEPNKDNLQISSTPHLDSLFEVSSDILLKYSPHNKKVVAANGAAASFFGYSQAELLKLHLADLGIAAFKEKKSGTITVQTKHAGVLVDIHNISIHENIQILNIQPIDNQETSIEQKYQQLYNQLKEVNNISKLLDDYAYKKIGDDYFQAIVNGLCHSLGAYITCIIEVIGQDTKAKTLYISKEGRVSKNFTYSLIGSPCQDVSNGKPCIYTRDVQSLFPDDNYLEEQKIQSYAGFPISIRDTEKESVWILVLLFKQPIENKEFYENILQFTSKRIQAEKERSLLLKTIQENEHKFKSLFENANDTIIIIDPQTQKIVDANHKAVDLLGYTFEELKELSVFDLHADDKESTINPREIFVQVTQNKRIRFEGILKTKDQVYIEVDVSASLVEFSGIKYIQGIIRDVSERIKKDKELRESKRLLEKSQELAKMGSWELALADYSLSWTKELYRIVELDESIPKTELYQYVREHRLDPTDIAVWEAALEESLAHKSNFNCAYKIKLDNGQVKYLSSSGELIVDQHNKPYKIIGTTQDITHNINQENKFKEIFNSFIDMYYEADMDGTFTMVSPSVINIFGLPPEKLIGTKLVNTYKNPKDRNLLLEELLEKGYAKSFRTIVFNNKGEEVFIEANVKLRKDIQGKNTGIMGVVRDISERIQTEILLQEKQYRLEKSQEIAQVGSWDYNLVSETHIWSKQHYKIFELDESLTGDALYDAFRERVHPDDMEIIDSVINNPTPKNTNFNYAYRLVFPDGRIKHLISKGQIIFDEKRGPIRIIGTIQDVTAKKMLEEELAKANEAEFAKLYQQQKIISEELEIKSKELNRFFELSIDMICILKLDGVILRVNPSFSRVLGFSEAELMSKPLYQFIHPDDMAATMEIGKTFFTGSPILEYKNRYITKDGGFRWLAWHSYFDKENEMIFAIARDITEEKKASKEIEDLKYTLDQTAIVINLDHEKCITNVNNKFCETTLYSKEEVIGQPYSLFFFHNQSGQQWEKLDFSLKSGEVWRGELVSKKKNGDIYWADTSIVPFCDADGKPFQYIAIQSDITQRKKLETDLLSAKEGAIKLANIKENFLANMSHEIRTPMNAILGFSQLLLENGLEEETKKEYGYAIHSSAENLLVVINDILDFSKMNSDKFKLEPVVFDIRKDINQVVQTLRPSFLKKNLSLEIFIDEAVPAIIKAPSNRISQIIINLLSNAVKFTPQGAVKLTIERNNGKQELRFQVIDSGIGIAEDKLEYIFDSFTQAEDYTTRVYGGTGLGLSISKKLVLLMDGEIGVHSKIGKGSTFFFTIPYEAVKHPSIIKTPLSSNFELQSFSDFRILVVEDNLLNQKLIKVHLRKFNIEFDLVENGQQAIEYISAQNYDMILMDIQMPVIDGIEATKIIREQGCETPIVAMTAHALEKEKQRYFEIGMNDYLPKPFRQEDLQQLILKYYKK